MPASFQAAQRAERPRLRTGGAVRGRRAPAGQAGGRLYRICVSLRPSTARWRHYKKNRLIFDFCGGTCDNALFVLSRPDPGGPVKVASRSVSRFHRLGGGVRCAACTVRRAIPQRFKIAALLSHQLTR